jgi:hypothetical protein
MPVTAWAIAITLIANAIDAWTPTRTAAYRTPTQRVVPGLPTITNARQLAQRTTLLRNRNPFRLERMPTTRRFGMPEPPPGGAIAQPAVPAVPVLTLAGILGGPPWSAIIEGIPGRETGVMLREGESAHGIRLEWIRRDSARISAADTAWVVTLKRPWR